MALTIIIPTLNAADMLPRCLAAVGAQQPVIVADGGSTDTTTAIAKRFDATVIDAACGRGTQLRAGAAATQTDWLLFLHADTLLDANWREAVSQHLLRANAPCMAAVFRFALDEGAPQARRLEWLVNFRTRVLGLPYGDQGLLIHRDLYASIGGFQDMPLMEDVDIIRRIGKRRFVVLDARAITSADKWRRSGWLRRSARNMLCLSLYFGGVPPATIAKVYGR